MILSTRKKVIKIRHKVGQSDVDAFLSEVRLAIADGRCMIDTRKFKNKRTIAALGLLPEDILDEISDLTYEDYIYGPEPDERPKHKGEDVWFFKKKLIGL